MQAGVASAQVFYLGVLYGFYQTLRNEFFAVVDACQMFGGVEDERGAGTEQIALLRSDDGAIGKFYGGGGHAQRLLAALARCHSGFAIGGVDAGAIERHRLGD